MNNYKRSWKIISTTQGSVIIPVKPLKCPVCGGKMVTHDFHVFYHPETKIRHADIHAKCLSCGYLATFGVPISEDEYKTLINSKLHAKTLTTVLLEEGFKQLFTDDEVKIIEERLKKMGYW